MADRSQHHDWSGRARDAVARVHASLPADTSYDEIVLVLEGKAKGGVPAGRDAHLRTVHAPRDGDAEIRAQARLAVDSGRQVVVVTADRTLAANVSPAQVVSPSWLLDRL